MNLKYLGKIFIVILICLVSLFIYKLDTVKTDKSIKEKAIKALKGKKYSSLTDRKDNQVSTDISLDKNKTDTVYWQCSINEYENFKLMQKINFHIGDGYSGMNINVVKLSNKYKTCIEHYSDTSESSKKYSVENQNLILDKTSYKKGDSMYGKINLKVEEKINNKNFIYYVEGYFKDKIK